MAEKVNTIGSGTAAGALEYLDFLSNKGHVAPGAVTSLKTGFTAVMKAVGGEEWGTTNVRDVDLDTHMTRFANMTQGKYNANSIIDYKSRVKKVITWYLQFLAKPGWAPDVKPRAKRSPKAETPRKATNGGASAAVKVEKTDDVHPPRVETDAKLVAYPFPLSSGVLATLYLPTKITAQDAERMGRHIQTLVLAPTGAHGE